MVLHWLWTHYAYWYWDIKVPQKFKQGAPHKPSLPNKGDSENQRINTKFAQQL